MLHIRTFQFNMLGENTYLLWTDEGEAMIVDCGAHAGFEKEELKTFIGSLHLQPKYHLLTHGHFDHTFGSKFLHDEYGLFPHVHQADVPIYPHGKEMVRAFINPNYKMDDLPEAVYFEEGKTFSLGQYAFRAIHTPGHTPGSVCFYCECEVILLTGDCRFACSIGLCDFTLGYEYALLNALREKVLTLPPDTMVYPGHGEPSTIGNEAANNPYLSFI